MTTMDDRAALATAAREMYRELCTPATLLQAQTDGWAPAVWTAHREAGFAAIGIPEAAGGSGGELADTLVVAREAGRFAAPIPVVEAGLLTGFLAASTGVALPPGLGVVAVETEAVEFDGDGRLVGTAPRVGWGRFADWVLLAVQSNGSHSVVVAPGPANAGARFDPATSLAGEPRDTLFFDWVKPISRTELPNAPEVLMVAALGRAAMMCGALDAVAELTRDYTSTRRQFGRPVGAFQAVQAHVVTTFQEAALANAALDGALSTPTDEHAMMAKIVAGQSAHVSTRAAHQAHGAMGVTEEYGLHHLTRRLWSWESEFGTARFWSGALGARLAEAGAAELYLTIAA